MSQVAVGGVRDQEDRPAYVRFETRVVEDRKATLAAGRFVGVDVEYVITTPPYSKDEVERLVGVRGNREDMGTWFNKMDADVAAGRFPAEWRDANVKKYEAWKQGLALPLSGTPIKGWSVISPAQQANLIAMQIFTVEDLAQINDEGMRRIPMQGLEFKNKAKAWLAQAQDKGPLTIAMAALQKTNENQATELTTLKEQVEALRAMIPSPQIVGSDTPREASRTKRPSE